MEGGLCRLIDAVVQGAPLAPGSQSFQGGMMTDFSEISSRYAKDSLVQKSAADQLFDLLLITEGEDVLDVGCGAGNLTGKIAGKTGGRVVGLDASAGMINEARRNSTHAGLSFEIGSVDQMRYAACFDVIFCNSAFQWFKDPQPALQACLHALRPDGRMGIQAPARQRYCPNFIEAVDKVRHDPRLSERFASFQPPWFFLETPEQYRLLFEQAGFAVLHARIDRVVSSHTPAEVFRIFDSGAAAGYLNREFYRLPIDEEYAGGFREVVQKAFTEQAKADGRVNLVFHRIFLLARKP